MTVPLRNVRFYSFDVLNGVNVLLELDLVFCSDMLFGVEMYGGSSGREAFTKFLQAHHASWSFPWLAYRVAGDLRRKVASFGSDAVRAISYYEFGQQKTQGSQHPSGEADAQLLDLYLGEVGAYTKLFLFTPFASFAERLWLKSLEKTYNMVSKWPGSVDATMSSLLQGVLSALNEHEVCHRLGKLAEVLSKASIDGNLAGRAKHFLSHVVGIELDGAGVHNSVALVFPVTHVQFIARRLGEKVCRLFSPQRIVVWTPAGSTGPRPLERLVEEGTRRRCATAPSVERRSYVVSYELPGMEAEERVANDILESLRLGSGERGAVVAVIDMPKPLLVALAEKVMDSWRGRVSLYVATPRISLSDDHITAVPVDIVRIL